MGASLSNLPTERQLGLSNRSYISPALHAKRLSIGERGEIIQGKNFNGRG